jgi:hypothetical protein
MKKHISFLILFRWCYYFLVIAGLVLAIVLEDNKIVEFILLLALLGIGVLIYIIIKLDRLYMVKDE